jgi:23S rRNA G2445 N2-methylase RlmL
MNNQQTQNQTQTQQTQQWLNQFNRWERFLIIDWAEKIIFEDQNFEQIAQTQTQRWWEWLTESEKFPEFYHYQKDITTVTQYIQNAIKEYIFNIFEDQNFKNLVEEVYQKHKL